MDTDAHPTYQSKNFVTFSNYDLLLSTAV